MFGEIWDDYWHMGALLLHKIPPGFRFALEQLNTLSSKYNVPEHLDDFNVSR